MAVFDGASGYDYHHGTPDDDIRDMLGGNDEVYASDGNDLVTRGAGTSVSYTHLTLPTIYSV